MRFLTARFPALVSCSVALMIIPVSVHTQYNSRIVDDGGTITGTVKFIGTPIVEKLEVTKDTPHCGSSKTSPRLSVGKDGGVQNAIIMLVDIKEGKPVPTESRAFIDQKGCEYSPHVQGVVVGTQLEVSNSDPLLHNVHAYEGTGKTLFNVAQPIKGQKTATKQMLLNTPGPVSVVCDAGHTWMSAAVMVVEHPYFAVTNENGAFKIENVPPGTFKIKMWHEGFQIAKKVMTGNKVSKYIFEEPFQSVKDVTVTAKGTSSLNFELKPRAQ